MKNLKLLVFLISLFLSVSLLFAQAPDTLWTKSIGGSGTQSAFSVIPTNDGGFMIGGYGTISGNRDFLIIKTDSDGVVEWTETYGEGERFESAKCMIETSDGNYIIAGGRADDAPYSSETDVYMVKVNDEGTEIWSSILGYDTISETANDIVETLDGGFVVCGNYWATSETVHDVFLIKTDSLGLEIWREIYSFETGMAEYAYGIEENSYGELLVTGSTQAFSGDYTENAYILKTNLLGELVWLETYGSNWPWYENSNHICLTSDGGYFLSGNINDDGLDNNWYVVKTDNNGIESWSHSFGGIYHDNARSACETTDNGFAVAGSYHDGVWKACVAKYNSDGDTVWTKIWGTSDDNSQYNKDIKQLDDGGFITVGYIKTDDGLLDVYLSRLGPELISETEQVPKHSKLALNVAPNPFSTETTITYQLEKSNHVSISIWDIFGQEKVQLLSEVKQKGNHEYFLSRKNIPPGIYLCKLSIGKQRIIKKIIIQ